MSEVIYVNVNISAFIQWCRANEPDNPANRLNLYSEKWIKLESDNERYILLGFHSNVVIIVNRAFILGEY